MRPRPMLAWLSLGLAPLSVSCGSSGDATGASRDSGAAGGAGNSLGDGGRPPPDGGGGTRNIFVDQILTRPGLCLPRTLIVRNGQVPCSIVEATTDPAEANCSALPGRKNADPALVDAARARMKATRACGDAQIPTPDCSTFRFCEIVHADASCLDATPGPTSIGWCYVDPSQGLGDPSIVASCPTTQRRLLRFVGNQTPTPGAMVLIGCSGFPVSP